MAKRTLRWGRLLGSLLILFLLVAGGLWFYRFQSRKAEAPPSSPVLVFLLSPSSGVEAEAGDYVPVTLQAVAPEAILSAELFVDGQSLGEVTDAPEVASWTWQAWPVGIHALSARATAADGQMGQSQMVIVNVLAGDGVMEVPAEEGQTLEQIGAGFGVPPNPMAGANPQLDPSQPLTGGQTVQVPVGEGNAGFDGAGNGSGQGGGPSPIPLILWQFTPTEPVDKSYCYTSTGGGVWEKMPKEPFEFFSGAQASYLQAGVPVHEDEVVIQMQCWGWQGDALRFLGQGETSFKTQPPPHEVMISSEGFQFLGLPQIPIPEDQFTGGGTKTIPPPFALREPSNTADCTGHGNALLASFICNTLLNAPLKEYRILEWEWVPEVCLSGVCQYGIDAIDGYRVYEINQFTKAEKLLNEVTNPNQKAAATHLPWGYYCYGVRAFVNDPVIEASAMTTYCPGEPPTPDEIKLPASYFLTVGDLMEFMYSGTPTGAVLVSATKYDSSTWTSSAGVKFELPFLPPTTVIQKAVLKFSLLSTKYESSVALPKNPKPSCLASMGRAKQDWTGLNGGEGGFVYAENILASSAYYAPYQSLPELGSSFEVDVTPVVKAWVTDLFQNHGFIFVPRPAPPQPLETDEAGVCQAQVGNFQLEIYYFAP